MVSNITQDNRIRVMKYCPRKIKLFEFDRWDVVNEPRLYNCKTKILGQGNG